jgi:hypothetical protein
VDLASSLLALARLSFAQLVDAGKLFSRTAMVQSPECAAAVLEVFFFQGGTAFLGGWMSLFMFWWNAKYEDLGKS